MSIYDDLDASVLEESIYTDLNPDALDDLSIVGNYTNIYDDLDVNIEVGTTTSDLKDRIDNTPWYESMAYELNKIKFNAIFGGLEGVGELYRSGMELLGKDVKNPFDEGVLAETRDLMGATQGVTPQEYQDSVVKDIARIGVQIAPVGAAVSAVSKLPKVAQAVSKVPKALRLPAGAGITEFIALASDEKGLADAVAEAGFENPLQKKDTDTILTGNFKNLAEGSVGGAFAKLGVKLADKAIIPAVNKTFSAIDKTLGTADKYIRPIKTKLKEIDPFVASRLDRFELDVLMSKQDFAERIKPFSKQFKKLKRNEQDRFQRLTSNSETMPEAYKMLDRVQKEPGMDGIKENFLAVRDSLDDLYESANRNGIDIEYRKDYLPRVMKDHEGYLKSLGVEPQGELKKMIRQAEQKKFDDLPEKMKLRASPKDTSLTSAEKSKVVQNFFEGNNLRGRGKMGLQKERTLATITEDTQKFYDDFLGGLQKYVDNVTYNVEKNRFLGKSTDPNARSIFEDIARISDDEAGDEATRLLKQRFDGGEARISGATNAIRNAIYASTIVNPYSTITQLGDLALNAYRNGLINTVSPFGPKIKLKDFGLNDIGADFADAGKMKKTMDFLFKGTGFKQLDVALKENNLRGAFRQAQSKLKNKNSKAYKDFVEENKPFFQNETDDLVDAIRRGDSQNENVKHYLFSRLTKTQPITLSEMPEQYLKMKGGRLAYSLKTFFVKQLDVLREDILKKLAKRETTKEGVQNAIRFAMLFGGGTTAVNITKDLALGRPVSIPDELIDTALQMTGISRYSIYKGRADGIGGFLAAILLPPMPLVNEVFKVAMEPTSSDPDLGKAIEKQSQELIRYVPVFGKDLYWRVGAGEEKIRKERLDQLRGKN
jgi:hypothetical protein